MGLLSVSAAETIDATSNAGTCLTSVRSQRLRPGIARSVNSRNTPACFASRSRRTTASASVIDSAALVIVTPAFRAIDSSHDVLVLGTQIPILRQKRRRVYGRRITFLQRGILERQFLDLMHPLLQVSADR
jgi:hypothetical protein